MSPISKFLAFLLALAVLAATAAWIMGGESSKSSTRISIEASPNQVFRYLINGEKIKQWGRDVVSAGPFEDSSGTIERILSAEGGDEFWKDSVLRFTPGESLSIQSRKGGLTKTYVFQLEENDLGGTNVQYRLTKSASGLEQFLFALENHDNVRPEMAAEMTRLKDLVESEVELEPDSDESVPVVENSPNDDNAVSNEAVATGRAESVGTSVVDQVLGPVYGNSNEDEKPQDGKRNFESLFGTGPG